MTKEDRIKLIKHEVLTLAKEWYNKSNIKAVMEININQSRGEVRLNLTECNL